jgi:hypothetical protein
VRVAAGEEEGEVGGLHVSSLTNSLSSTLTSTRVMALIHTCSRVDNSGPREHHITRIRHQEPQFRTRTRGVIREGIKRMRRGVIRKWIRKVGCC